MVVFDQQDLDGIGPVPSPRGRARRGRSRHPRAARRGAPAPHGREDAGPAAALGLSRQLTGRFSARRQRGCAAEDTRRLALDPYKPCLRRRWDVGIITIAVLHGEITALGYAGSEPTTYAGLALPKLAAPPKPPAPSSKQQVTEWMLTDPARLDGGQQARLNGTRLALAGTVRVKSNETQGPAVP